MYFNTISLTESFEFTIKNLIDILTIPGEDPILRAEEKLRRVKNEFNTLYEVNDAAKREIISRIEDFDKKSGDAEVIDMEKVDRFHHLHLRIKLLGDGTPLSSTDFVQFYTLFYRSFFNSKMPSNLTKYNLPYFIDGKYLIFIIFDETAVEKVLTIASQNQLDLRAPIYLIELNVPGKIFVKNKN